MTEKQDADSVSCFFLKCDRCCGKIKVSFTYLGRRRMIRFICGRTGSGKSESIAKNIESSQSDRIFLIVPEQQAVTWERRCASEFSPNTNLRLEVLTFTRLFNRTAREYGGFFQNIAGKASRQLIMWAALGSVKDKLSYYSSVRTEKLVPQLMQAVKELHTYRVTPQMLEETADELMGDGADNSETMLARKLSDLSLIFAAYEELLHSSYSDSDDLPEHTAKTVLERRFFADADVFIDSFYSYTPAQLDMIRAAMRDAANVTISVSCFPEDKREAHLAHLCEHFGLLCRTAEKFGGYTVERLTENRRASSSRLSVLEKSLWDHKICRVLAESEDDRAAVTVVKCRDRYSESAAAAAKVCELVRGGERYGSIAVIARDAAMLDGITDTVFSAKGIPLYTSRRGKLADLPATSVVMSALRAAAFGCRREDITAIVKTGLMPHDSEACCLFEKYTETWRLRGRRAFLGEDDWCMNPAGFGAIETDETLRQLEKINAVRRTLAVSLSSFFEVFDGGSATSYSVAVAVYKLLCDMDVPDATSKLAARLRSLGYETEASETLGMWNSLMQAIDALATAMPDTLGDAESFTYMMAEVINATDVGTIPTGIDVVNFGSADMLRLDDVRHVIVLGAVEGEFPAAPRCDGILTESDRIMLEGCGVKLSANGTEKLGEELFLFYKAVCSASKSVTLIVPENIGGEVRRPSLGVMRLYELFPDMPTVNFSAFDPEMSAYSERDIQTYLTDDKIAGEVARLMYPERAEKLSAVNCGSVDSSDMDKIFDGKLNLSQSAIDMYSTCPYKYFSSQVLKLREEITARMSPMDVGTFMHAVLEQFFRAVRGKKLPLGEAEERALCDSICEREARRLWDGGAVSGRQRYLLRRLRASVGVFIRSLSLEFEQSLFEPWRFEQSVGYDSPGSVPVPAIVLPNGWEIYMRGRIDRIDVMRESDEVYVRVVDYKTSAKEFRLSDIYDGVNLQLLLYLFTIWKSPPSDFREALADGRRIVPAGALYFSARPGEAKSDRYVPDGEAFEIALEDVSRTGVILSDRRIAEAMDRGLSGRYAPAKPDGEGGLKESAGCVDLEKFVSLYSDVCDIIGKIGENIACGKAEAVPRISGNRSPCNYCAYFPMCRKGKRDE